LGTWKWARSDHGVGVELDWTGASGRGGLQASESPGRPGRLADRRTTVCALRPNASLRGTLAGPTFATQACTGC
jgi:hypothetical protein